MAAAGKRPRSPGAEEKEDAISRDDLLVKFAKLEQEADAGRAERVRLKQEADAERAKFREADAERVRLKQEADAERARQAILFERDGALERRRLLASLPEVLSSVAASSFGKSWRDALCLKQVNDVYALTTASPMYFCGRPAVNAPLPAVLFVEGFSVFASTLEATLPSSIFSATPRAPVAEGIPDAAEELSMILTSVFDTEKVKQAYILKHLPPVFGVPDVPILALGAHGSKTDGGIQDDAGRASFMLEVKNEIASSGDAFMQAMQYFVQMSSIHHMPCLIMLAYGPYLTFAAGFWYNNDPHVEPLFPTVHVMMNHWSVTMVAHLLNAAKACVTQLNASRKADEARFAKVPMGRPLTAPWPDTVPGYKIRYLRQQQQWVRQTRILFTAEMTGTSAGASAAAAAEAADPRTSLPTLVMVKFSRRYGADAHHAAATAGFAPPLYAVQELPGGWIMTVMGFLPRANGWYMLRSLTQLQVAPSAVAEPEEPRLTNAMHADINSILQKKYKAFRDQPGGPWVHGDLHQANLMVCIKGESVTDIMAVDFDWAGKQGSVTYDMFINTSLAWHEDVKAQGVIRAEHDEYLISRDVGKVHDAPTPPQRNSPQAAPKPAAEPDAHAPADVAPAAGPALALVE